MKIIVSPSERRRSSSRSRICAWIEHVERRDRLVGDEQFGPDGERAGDADPLALSAGELARVLARVVRTQPHLCEELRDPLRAVLRGADRVDREHLEQRAADRLPRIERRVRILQDDLHPLPVRQQATFVEAREVHVLVPHLSRVGPVQPQHAPAEGALAAPGLADEPERAPAVEVEGHPVHGVDALRGPAAAPDRADCAAAESA